MPPPPSAATATCVASAIVRHPTHRAAPVGARSSSRWRPRSRARPSASIPTSSWRSGAFTRRLDVIERPARAAVSRAPIVGWVGDAFGAEAAPLAALYDVVAHTDSALEARHRALGFAAPSLWLPHAANPHRAVPVARSSRQIWSSSPPPRPSGARDRGLGRAGRSSTAPAGRAARDRARVRGACPIIGWRRSTPATPRR